MYFGAAIVRDIVMRDSHATPHLFFRALIAMVEQTNANKIGIKKLIKMRNCRM